MQCHRPIRPQIQSVALLDTARVALFVDAEHFRRCAARAHERLTGARTIPSWVNIDGAGISEWVERAAVELGWGDSGRRRSSRRLYDVLSEGRLQRWQQRRYHGVLEAEGLVVKTARLRAGNRMQARAQLDRAVRHALTDVLDRDAHGAKSVVEASVASDLVRLTKNGQIDTALLLAGDRAYAGAVGDASRHGAEVVLIVPPGSSALVAESLREAATRAIALHPEVFEMLFRRCRARPRSAAQTSRGRCSARSLTRALAGRREHQVELCFRQRPIRPRRAASRPWAGVSGQALRSRIETDAPR